MEYMTSLHDKETDLFLKDYMDLIYRLNDLLLIDLYQPEIVPRGGSSSHL